MDGLNTHLLEPAHSFFEKEVYHINIALGGLLSQQYRDYLVEKKEYFNMASTLIRQELFGGKC